EALDARILERVFEVVKDRINNPKPDSYVSKLSSQGEDASLQKIGEEATELVLAAKNQDKNNIIHEAADLIFHTMVLLAQKNLEISEVFEELEKRHMQKTQQKTSKQ
ncbi:MAG: phosphoribosyl-ATP diphosphatase, partial [Candidatus Bathyarchaeia archaeon]